MRNTGTTANVISCSAAISADEKEKMFQELADCDRKALACNCGAPSLFELCETPSCKHERDAAVGRRQQLRKELGLCKECGDQPRLFDCRCCGRKATLVTFTSHAPAAPASTGLFGADETDSEGDQLLGNQLGHASSVLFDAGAE
eukprot:635648-Karenia_brevis.AAC.1